MEIRTLRFSDRRAINPYASEYTSRELANGFLERFRNTEGMLPEVVLSQAPMALEESASIAPKIGLQAQTTV